MMTFKKKAPKGAAMVEYAVLLGAVTLIAVLGVSILGHKTSDIIGALAVVLPGAHADDNASITSGKLIETTSNAGSPEGTADAAATLTLDAATIQARSNTFRLGNNTGLGDSGGATTGLEDLLVEVD